MTNQNKTVTTVHRFDQIESMIYTAPCRKDLFADAKFANLFSEKIDELMPDGLILSLDIFDTLILRDGSSELTRFFEIGEKIAEFCNNQSKSRQPMLLNKNKRIVRPVDAFLARHMGTKASYRISVPQRGCREGSLTEIHQTASSLLNCDEDLSDTFISIELNYETTRLIPNKLILDYVRRHRERGGRVVLVSDMYMHADQIMLLLKKLDLDQSLFDTLISSADTKVSKATGGIFSLVEKAMKANPEDFIHLGDSLIGDFRKPREHGWRAFHMPIPEQEILIRRDDHVATATRILEEFNLAVDIAMPK
jgi:predicted HAD superfamily hydrolase